MFENTKIGLVLAGGGKGSYEIGVWKYLHEIGFDKKISVISGTSVGALNAVLIANGDYELAERIWLEEIDDKILDTKSSSRKNGALFSREGLLQIIDKNIDLEKIKTCGKTVYATCFKVNGLEAEAIKLNSCSVDKMKDYLLATSAIPIAFEAEKIRGKTYIDGGVLDNVPLKPLIDEKCTHALIINLRKNYHRDYSGFDIKTFAINPSCELGVFTNGTLDFSRKRAEQRISLGYNDCKKNDLELKSFLHKKDSKEESKIMTEEEAIAKIDAINEMNHNTILLETLKKLIMDSSLVGQIQVSMNAEMGTMGGKFFWHKCAAYGGWQWQRNKITGHIRLLDNLDNRRVWGKYYRVVNTCKNFLSQEVKRELENSQKYGK